MHARIILWGVLLTGLPGLDLGARAAAVPNPPLSTPPGITLRDVIGTDGRLLWRYLGDAHGKPLYTFDADGSAGKARCVGPCVEEFPPYLAAIKGSAGGDWSLIPRGAKQRQWAYKGHPLYSYRGADPSPNHVSSYQFSKDFVSDKAAVLEAASLDPGSVFYSPKKGWRRAAFQAAQSIAVPSGIALKSMPAANGYGFVDQSTGLPLYVLRTRLASPEAWTPMYAPDLAHQVGDFSIVMRSDGRKQWAYRGQALYFYKGDYTPDDLSGLLGERGARPALAYQHFLPPSVQIQVVPMHGPLMMTSGGLSLYTETRYRHGGYEESKALGTRGCVEECLKTWKPLLASAQDQASGFWEIEERSDGTRQWAYKGASVYTYAGDSKPGDVEGNKRIVIVYGDQQGKIDLALTGGDRAPVRRFAGSGFYWSVVNFDN